jgi:hypothetical protein
MARAALVLIMVALWLPEPAGAVLVYERTSTHPHEIVAARNDGTDARVIGHGSAPQVSPHGHRVAYVTDGGSRNLYVVGNRGHGRRRIAEGVFAPTPIAWSLDGRYVVLAVASGDGAYLVDVRTAKQTRIALHDDYSGAAFAPDGRRFAVCAQFPGDTPHLSVFRVGSKQPRRLGEGCDPTWGPLGMAFDRPHKVLFRDRIGEDARTVLDEDVSVRPVDLAADGRTLLVIEEARFSVLPVLVDVKSGGVSRGDRHLRPAHLSRDGETILGEAGGDVVESRIDGDPQVLAPGATSPSWTK